MCAAIAKTGDRIELWIDVFDQTKQRALARRDLTPTELIDAILNEFRQIEFLNQDASNYQLMRLQDRQTLDPSIPIGRQLTKGERLALQEKERPLPADARRPTCALYLREGSEDRVFRIDWLPAIIGRADKKLPHDELVAVNLESMATGLRVSRRHARITEKNGDYYIENLSNNPTTVIRANDSKPLIRGVKMTLKNEDVIRLDRSGITLKVLIREPKQQDVHAEVERQESNQAESETDRSVE
jgi:hypothetical protein